MTPVLFLHGFTGSPRSLAPILDCLQTSCSILAPPLVGHDGSKAGAEIQTFEQEVDRIAGMLVRRSIHLVGYSMGARLALGLLVRHAQHFRRATLISAHPGLSSDGDRAARVRSDAVWCELLERQGIEAFVNAWEAQPLWETQRGLSPRLLAFQRHERLAHSPAGLSHCLRATGLGVMPDLRPLLPRVHVPVTLMAGGRDAKFCDLAGEMARLLPRAELLLAPDAGHNLLLERPDLVTQALTEGP